MHKNVHVKMSTVAAHNVAKTFMAYCILQIRVSSNKLTILTIFICFPVKVIGCYSLHIQIKNN